MNECSSRRESVSSIASYLDDSPYVPPQRAQRIGVSRNKINYRPPTFPQLIVDEFLPRRNEYRYTDLASPSDEIRLLVLHPGRYDEKIECSLMTVLSSDRKLHYEALSYHWGGDEPTKEIWIRSFKGSFQGKAVKNFRSFQNIAHYVKPHKFYIRSNLYAALRQFRDTERELIYWIDALCINQDNQQEKNMQVLKMADIYSKAYNVCIWLGEGNEQSNMAIDFIPSILNLSQFDALINDQNMLKHWTAFADLMRSTWFSRRWVVQEIVYAREATLHCGSATIHWADFADAVALFVTNLDTISTWLLASRDYSKGLNVLGHVPASGATILVNATSNLFRKSNNGYILEHRSSLETLVSTLLTFGSSDPRDTIYALLSVAKDTTSHPGVPLLTDPPSPTSSYHSAEESVSLTANYTKNIVEVYKDFTSFCVQSSRSLDIICRHWAPSERKKPFTVKESLRLGKMKALLEIAKFPSWVPRLAESAFGGPEEALNGRKNGDSLVGHPARRFYSASRGTDADNIRFEEYPIERSVEIRKEQQKPRMNPTTEGDNYKEPSQNETIPVALAHDKRTDSADTIKATPETFGISMFVHGFQIGTIASLSARLAEGMILNESLRMGGWEEPDDDSSVKVPDQLWRTLVADRGPDGNSPPSWYHRACLHCFANRNNTGDINTAVLIARGVPTMMVEFLKRVQSVVWNRKLLQSENGRWFGLAPTRAEVDDIICILYGCSVPVILREHRTHTATYFEFIGESYIHGAMDGQAMSGTWKEQEYELR
ncbi:hypothetical protein MMC26_005858 [Xylographa opegraphella]|nr:hypothetical protein [Xylographa opegraphella]